MLKASSRLAISTRIIQQRAQQTITTPKWQIVVMPDSRFSTIRSVKFENAASVKSYPNPTPDVLKIDAENLTSLKMFNTTGCMVHAVGNNLPPQVSVKELPAGMYLEQITHSNGQASTQKIIVTR
ncbi:T9SS type A sorting domain-containing protein [Dyadobacter sp. CY312]|uniref:T9SS type A sorting domain-containing protein n=1 Tax=Dyadobacter sp. CY312 TaxID=2907303 RepID=UPI001F19969B|nr:T9SS type A sorting domain-containing protein [Dyadobacter sp. CY312]MCE7044209.1 T9SS type A sorting domain-containing protein [Dyadobacter sp. CY312]